jgi:hypothetical protein
MKITFVTVTLPRKITEPSFFATQNDGDITSETNENHKKLPLGKIYNLQILSKLKFSGCFEPLKKEQLSNFNGI